MAHKVTGKNRDGVHQTFTHDDPQIAFLLTVDTAHKILVTKVPWFTLVQNWGRVSAILASPQEALHEAWVGSIIIVIVQLYYLRRLAKFASTTRHAHAWYLWLVFVTLVSLSFTLSPLADWVPMLPHIALIQVALSVLQVPVTVAYCVFSINKSNIFIPINLDLKRVGLVASVVVDFVIAVAMIMLLKDTDSVDGAAQFKPFRRISRIMRRLTVTIVNTGLVTAVVTIISLILASDETASGTDFWTAIAQYPQCSIYFSTFLANLNARHFIRGSGDDMTVSNMEDIRFANTVKTQSDAEAGLTNRHIMLSQMGSEESSSSGLDTSSASNLEKYTCSDGTLSRSHRDI
ncbi:hypothetical protein C8J55DRAFT_560550 [Lentinula edodes]|uniref:DUF6534 domain-containing protein n=1 Tax=Lentinula lateritia TaxID=40482 RepID=A0A9W9AFE7_9AGAR|nr:hypothetical protein C8J55DRAFT_560550 [Lentinula edodes]